MLFPESKACSIIELVSSKFFFKVSKRSEKHLFLVQNLLDKRIAFSRLGGHGYKNDK